MTRKRALKVTATSYTVVEWSHLCSLCQNRVHFKVSRNGTMNEGVKQKRGRV